MKLRGTFLVHLPKKNPGEQFSNLGMLTTLLGNSSKVEVKSAGAQPRIELIDDDKECCEDIETASSEEVFSKVQKKEFDWTENGTCVYEEKLLLTEGMQCYGFTGQHSGVFTKLKDEIPSIVDIPDPDHTPVNERKIARVATEQSSFNPDHYLADLFDDAEIHTVMSFNPAWDDQLMSQGNYETNVILTDSEKIFMKDLPNKEYLVDYQTERSLYLGLVDLIFAYAYDYRITEGDTSVESAWNICKISSTLSWFDIFSTDIHDVIYTCMRRCLCYPLYRHWRLAELVKKDTEHILRQGKNKVLQCLISIHKTFSSTEPYYILNNLYITDYCIWIQRSKQSIFYSLANEIDKVVVEKSSIGFDLPQLEEAAHLVIEEENGTKSDDSEFESEEDSEEETDEVNEEDHEHQNNNGDNEISLLCSKLKNMNAVDNH